MKSSNYYLFILNPEEWEFVKEQQIIGTKKEEIYNHIKSNDKIFIYVTEQFEIKSLFEVEYKIDSNENEIKSKFPYNLKISLIKYFDKKPDFKTIVDKLSFIKKRDKWGSYIGGTKVRELSLKDYTAIIKFLQ